MNNWDHAYLTGIQGKVQEEELDSWRAAGERGRKLGWMRVQGETSMVSPCAILARKNEGRRNTAPRWMDN
jgi:hypothetical protein